MALAMVTLYKNNKTAGKAMIAKMWRKGESKSSPNT